MSAFGRGYTNWSIIVLTMKDFHNLLSRLKTFLPETPRGFIDVPIHVERKQAQRERLVLVEVPIKSHKFSMGQFLYMRKYFELNGVTGKLPSLVFKDEPSCRQLMDPILKVGFIHATEDQCFEVRKPQCAMKIAQPKVTTTKHGVKGKVKGKIVVSEKDENYFAVSEGNS